MGGRSIACLNARDRNLLGFRRDLLTAAAYGVDQFLFVYGDRPTLGRPHRPAHRAVDDAASCARSRRRTTTRPSARSAPGVSAGAGTLPEWKRDADFLFAQVRFSLDELLEWRGRHRVRRTGVRGRHGRAERGDGAQDLGRHPAARGPRRRGCARSSATRWPGVELACDLVARRPRVGRVRRRAPHPGEPVSRGRGPARGRSSPRE